MYDRLEAQRKNDKFAMACAIANLSTNFAGAIVAPAEQDGIIDVITTDGKQLEFAIEGNGSLVGLNTRSKRLLAQAKTH